MSLSTTGKLTHNIKAHQAKYTQPQLASWITALSDMQCNNYVAIKHMLLHADTVYT